MDKNGVKEYLKKRGVLTREQAELVYRAINELLEKNYNGFLKIEFEKFIMEWGCLSRK